MRPYFETKVVKVKKGEKENYCWQCGIKMLFNHHYCPYCGNRLEREKPKGNWINNENLDKIKFPCFCSYIDKTTKVKCYAEMNQGHGGYKLSRLFQADGDSIFYGDISLKRLIEYLDIHILKGKIIIFDEEE